MRTSEQTSQTTARAGLPVVAPPTGGDWHERAPDLANMLVAVCVLLASLAKARCVVVFGAKHVFVGGKPSMGAWQLGGSGSR